MLFQSKTLEDDEVVVKIQYSSHHSCYLERKRTMTTMIGEPTRSCHHCDVPPWDPLFPVVITSSVNFNGNAWCHDSVMAMRGCLPSHHPATDEVDIPVDVFSSDYFRIFDFKVRRCVRGRAHDWTECPYAHPGEKARRRDPRKYHYSGTPCEEFRKGSCRKGDSCEFGHGVFECWLHPARYRTQPCKDGVDCQRRVCFFAHSPEQLRIVNQNDLPAQGPYELFVGGSPSSSVRIGLKEPFVSSPTSILASPPLSPLSEGSPMRPNRHLISCQSVSEIVSSMQNVHLARKKKSYPCEWKFDNPNRSGLSACEYWGWNYEEEEPAMERVESGRNLRLKMYAKLSKENSLGRNESAASSPDIGWVSELIK